MNTVLAAKETSRPKTNNIEGLKQKYEELALKLSWIEKLDSVNKPAPLAPELGNYFYLYEYVSTLVTPIKAHARFGLLRKKFPLPALCV